MKMRIPIIMMSLLCLYSYGRKYIPVVRDVVAKHIIDTAVLTVTYSYRHITDTLYYNSYIDQYALQIGKKYNKFYSLFCDKTDSIAYRWNKSKESEKVDAATNIGVWLASNETYNGDEYYANLPTQGMLTEIQRVSSLSFRYIETAPQFNWQMDMLGPMQQILGYKCQKAATSFRGRKWEVWFTTEIPISSGPWKFSGLPGMILKATDNSGYFKYEAVGITQHPQPIYLYNDDIKTISRKEMRRLLDMRWKDPLGLFFAFRPTARFVKPVNGQLVDMVSGEIVYPYIPLLELE